MGRRDVKKQATEQATEQVPQVLVPIVDEQGQLVPDVLSPMASLFTTRLFDQISKQDFESHSEGEKDTVRQFVLRSLMEHRLTSEDMRHIGDELERAAKGNLQLAVCCPEQVGETADRWALITTEVLREEAESAERSSQPPVQPPVQRRQQKQA